MASIGSRYSDPEVLAAGGKSNLKKRAADTPDIFPDAKRPKLNNVKEVIRGVTANVQAFSGGIRSGSAGQLLRQMGAMNGNVPSLAYAHVPIHTVEPRFLPSKYVTQIAEEGELTLVFLLPDKKNAFAKFTLGGGLRYMNWQVASLTLDGKKFFKEGFEAAAVDPKLLQLHLPSNIADICAFLGVVFIPDVGAPKGMKKSVTNPSDLVVQVYGLVENQLMKDMWPDAPLNSRLFLELRKVNFDSKTTFHFANSKKMALDASVFANGAPKSAYQFVPTFIPPDLDDYIRNHPKKECYVNPANYRMQVGVLTHRDNTPKRTQSVSPAELSRGVCWNTCATIKVLLSTRSYWKRPRNVAIAAPMPPAKGNTGPGPAPPASSVPSSSSGPSKRPASAATATDDEGEGEGVSGDDVLFAPLEHGKPVESDEEIDGNTMEEDDNMLDASTHEAIFR